MPPNPEPRPDLRRWYANSTKPEKLDRFRQLVAKKLTLRAASVFQQRDLAICLHALGRDDEALLVADWPQRAVVPRGKMDAWYAAHSAWAVAARIRRLRGERDRDLQRFIDKPAHAMMLQPELWKTRKAIETELAPELARFEKAAGEEDIDSMAWAIAEHIFYRETAQPPFPHAAIDVTTLDETIDNLLARLRVELG